VEPEAFDGSSSSGTASTGLTVSDAATPTATRAMTKRKSLLRYHRRRRHHRHALSSPTLGEIALKRKLTDRLPTRKAQKRWPEAKNFASFDLNFDRKPIPNASTNVPAGSSSSCSRELTQNQKAAASWHRKTQKRNRERFDDGGDGDPEQREKYQEVQLSAENVLHAREMSIHGLHGKTSKPQQQQPGQPQNSPEPNWNRSRDSVENNIVLSRSMMLPTIKHQHRHSKPVWQRMRRAAFV